MVSPSSVNFGSVTVGSSASATVVLSNTGGSPLTAAEALQEAGAQAPGEDRQAQVTQRRPR